MDTQQTITRLLPIANLIIRGGHGSGNFGHTGRPGHKGGSGTGGGKGSGVAIREARAKEGGGGGVVKKVAPVGGEKKLGYLSKEMKSTEDKIASLQKEVGAVFDKNGKKLFETGNDSVNEITFSEAQLRQMKGAVVTHNHPDYNGVMTDGGSFSMSDIQLMVNTGAAEVRAVTKNYIYRARPKIISGTNVSRGAMDFAQQTSSKLKSDLSAQVKAGKIDGNEAQLQHWHKLWSAVADQGFIEYERIPR